MFIHVFELSPSKTKPRRTQQLRQRNPPSRRKRLLQGGKRDPQMQRNLQIGQVLPTLSKLIERQQQDAIWAFSDSDGSLNHDFHGPTINRKLLPHTRGKPALTAARSHRGRETATSRSEAHKNGREKAHAHNSN